MIYKIMFAVIFILILIIISQYLQIKSLSDDCISLEQARKYQEKQAIEWRKEAFENLSNKK